MTAPTFGFVVSFDEKPDELDEVLINGQKPSRKPSEIITWMRRYRLPARLQTGEGAVKRASPVMLLLLAFVASLLSSESLAQARTPMKSAQNKLDDAVQTADAQYAKKLAELEVWLQRLVGHFRIDGFAKVLVGFTTDKTCLEGSPCYSRGPTQGAGDCARVGAGAGVHCAFSVAFLAGTSELRGLPKGGRWPGPFLDSAMILYGIDTESARIRFLLVDAKSIAYEAFGILEGDWVTFKSGCVNEPSGMVCTQLFRIRAKSDDSSIEMRFDKLRGPDLTTFGYLFNLYRLPAEQ